MSAQSDRVEGAERPDSELVALLADGLRAAGFAVVDVKEQGLLVKAGAREIMIGVRCV